MQSIKKLQKILETLSDDTHNLFSISDFEAVFPELQYNALKTLLSRAEKSSLLKRVCRGVSLYNKNLQSDKLTYDIRCGIWRPMDLIDWSAVDESV